MEGLKQIALMLNCATDVLVFDSNEEPITDNLRQFLTVSKLPQQERAIARHLLEGLVFEHDALRWERVNGKG